MAEYLNNLKTLADKIERQSKSVDEKESVCQLLSILPKSWCSSRAWILPKSTLPLAWNSIEGAVMAEFFRRKQTLRNQATEFSASLAAAKMMTW